MISLGSAEMLRGRLEEGHLYIRLMEMLVGSVLLYGAEVWGGGGQLEPVERV